MTCDENCINNKHVKLHVVYKHTKWEVCVLPLSVLIVDFILLPWMVSVANHEPPIQCVNIQHNNM